MNRDQSSRNNTDNDRSRSQRRLALALLLILMLAGMFFFISDSPGIVRYREILLGELRSGGENDPEEAQTEDAGAAETQSEADTDQSVLPDPDSLPEFSGGHYVRVNGGTPAFPDAVYEKAGYTSGGGPGPVSENGTVWTIKRNGITAYEYYGELDELGRCTVAYGCLGRETMPAEGSERGDISRIHPSGWAKAQRWERCHLIAWALSDENDNEANLITGTHYLNYDGMRPLEEETEHYIWNTGNHVLYMARPYYYKDELIARGVQLTAMSVEDGGKGLSFNVYLFNVTPGAEINYRNGVVTTGEQAAQEARAYVINTRSGVFHYPTCDGAKSIYEKNRREVTATRKELTDQGYIPCGYCEP